VKLTPRQIAVVRKRKRLLLAYYRKQGGEVPKGFRVWTPVFGAVAREMFVRVYKHVYKTGKVGFWSTSFTAKLEDAQLRRRAKAMQIARTQVGVKETTRNGGGMIDTFKKETLGFTDAAPWCADFVNWCFLKAGDRLTFNNPRFCPNYVTAARERRDRWVQVFKDIKPGDCVLFDWGGDGVADHIGFVDRKVLGLVRLIAGPVATVEGNTGADPNDPSGLGFGDGVHRRWRRKSQILMVARRLDEGEAPPA
jgi:hypothetical protein